MKLNQLRFLITFFSLAAFNRPAFAQSSAFTYQGQLNNNGTVAGGTYDLLFTLLDASTNGNLVGGPLTSTVTVSNGLFTTQVDFGAVAFNGAPRWLQIGVRTNGSSGGFAFLSPLQPITSAPYALQSSSAATATVAATANSIAAANITGTLSTPQLPTNLLFNAATGVTLTGTFVGNGSGLTSLNALQLTNGPIPLSQLPPAVVTNNAPSVTLTGTFNGNGAGLTNLNASQLTTGSVPLGELSPAVVTNNATGVILGGTFTGDGSALTNLNQNALNNVVLVPKQTNVFSAAGTYNFTIPALVSKMVVKLWGAGGAAYETGGTGGAGAFSMVTLAVTPSANYTAVVGQGGGLDTGGGNGSNDGSGGGDYCTGGQASSLFNFTGSTYIMKSVAGGGGGGFFAAGGAGGNPGQNGTSFGGGGGGSGGYNIAGGAGGNNGVISSFGGNYYSFNALTTGETNLSLMGGAGGRANTVEEEYGAGGGGGGGYGGGGGGLKDLEGCGGGGGGSYGDLIIGGNRTVPGNTNDANYFAPKGVGAASSGNNSAAGQDGLIVVIFYIPATTLNGTLAVTGNTSLSGLTVASNATFSSGLISTGTTLVSSLTATGTTLVSNLTATGATLASNLTVTGTTTLAGSVSVTGIASFSGTGQTFFNGLYARGGPPGGNGFNNNGYAFFGNGGDTDSGMFSLADGQISFYANAADTMDVIGNNVNINGIFNVTGIGSLYTSGSVSGFFAYDRAGTSSGYWAFYAHNGRASLYSSVIGGDRFSVDTSGVVRAPNFTTTSSPDIAETISAASDVETGDIVCADPLQRESVIRCGKESHGVLGVISDGSGGFLVNAHGASLDAPLTGKPLVLAGRVPVKVCLENGPVHIGDTLAPSSIPGVAMRATGTGATIGIALDNFAAASLKAGTSSGTVLCFVKVTEGPAPSTASEVHDLLSERDARIEALEKTVSELKAALNQLGTHPQNIAPFTP